MIPPILINLEGFIVDNIFNENQLELIRLLLAKESNRLHCKINDGSTANDVNAIDQAVVAHSLVNRTIGKIDTITS